MVTPSSNAAEVFAVGLTRTTFGTGVEKSGSTSWRSRPRVRRRCHIMVGEQSSAEEYKVAPSRLNSRPSTTPA